MAACKGFTRKGKRRCQRAATNGAYCDHHAMCSFRYRHVDNASRLNCPSPAHADGRGLCEPHARLVAGLAIQEQPSALKKATEVAKTVTAFAKALEVGAKFLRYLMGLEVIREIISHLSAHNLMLLIDKAEHTFKLYSALRADSADDSGLGDPDDGAEPSHEGVVIPSEVLARLNNMGPPATPLPPRTPGCPVCEEPVTRLFVQRERFTLCFNCGYDGLNAPEGSGETLSA